jgi:hypothetical protein
MQLAGQKRWAVLHNSQTRPAIMVHCCMINFLCFAALLGSAHALRALP